MDGSIDREVATRVYFAFMHTGEVLRHQVQQQLRDDGDLSYVQFRILATLLEAGGSKRMTDLADEVVYSQGGLTYQIKALEQAGLADRASAPDDDRAVMARITAAGRQRLEQVIPGHVALVEKSLFGHVSAADVAMLDDVLGRVQQGLDALPRRSSTARSKKDPRQAPSL